MTCPVCRLEDQTGESFPHYPCAKTYESEPPQWQDGQWWRSANAIRDVGEQHALARREANRMRRQAWTGETLG